MTTNDKLMVLKGATLGVVDSIYPRKALTNPATWLVNNESVKGLLLLIWRLTPSQANSNYYFVSGKAYTEYAVFVTARVIQFGSYVAAADSLAQAGISFTGGLLVFAGTGGLGTPAAFAIEVTSVGSLVSSGICAIVGTAAGAVGNNANEAVNTDKNILKSQIDEAVAEAEAAISEISDSEAIASGITDVTETQATAVGRPSWRQSEIDFAPEYPESSGYTEQACFKKDANGNVVNAKWGESGSIRIDVYKSDHIVEIKNYDVSSSTGRSNLVNNIRQQYWQRKDFFPNVKQTYLLDVRGQNVSLDVLNQLENSIYNNTETLIDIVIKR